MLTEKQFYDFDEGGDDKERDIATIRRAIWARLGELKISQSVELVTLLEEIEQTIYFAYQSGYSNGYVAGGRIWDPYDDMD